MPRSLRRVALSLPLAVLLLVAFGVMPEAMPRVSAQLPLPKYKVGDRVEADAAQASTPERAVWKKGTVTKIDLPGYTCQVQLDPAAGQSPRMLTVPLRPYAEGWLRPLHSVGAAAEPQNEIAALHIDANGTVLANRQLLECQHFHQLPAHNGRELMPRLAQRLIRCVFEKPSAMGSDGATTIDIQSLDIGTPHKWNLAEDHGPGGAENTMVYPVRAAWTQTTFYRTYNEILPGKEQMFNCYVNVDMWLCGQSQVVSEGNKTLIPVR